MIRFIILATTLFLFLGLGSPLLLYEWVLGKSNPQARDRQCVAIVRFMFGLLLKISGTKVSVEGRENIPEGQAVLYVGNHTSYFDILIGYTTTKGLLGFVAKKLSFLKELDGVCALPFFGPGEFKRGAKDHFDRGGKGEGGDFHLDFPGRNQK